MKRFAACLFAAAGLALAPLDAASAITLGQVDDFEDGTTQGWTVALGPGGGGHPAPPANLATGGPAGAGDNFLLLTSLGGFGPGSRMTAMNGAQWSGDYLSANVGAIGMWVNNFGQNDLNLQLFVEDPSGGPPANGAYSTDSIFVAAGGGWTRIRFSLDPDDLTAAFGSVQAALSGATILRLFHGPIPGVQGLGVAAQLGVDNIEAIPVPEPATWAMMILGFGAVGLALRRRRRLSPSVEPKRLASV